MYESIENQAIQEFSDISDYIWKSTRLIDHETQLEKEKLRHYFPNDIKSNELRWKYESNKLNSIFPYLIAVGNLFNVLSVFESYLLLLSIEVEKHSSVKLKNIRGNGIKKMFNFFRQVELDIENISHFEQVNASIKIRNCFMHACGVLDWSKEDKELERIQKSLKHLSKEHRNDQLQKKDTDKILRIVNSPLGKKLELDNTYPFLLTNYLRCFFIEICQKARTLDKPHQKQQEST